MKRGNWQYLWSQEAEKGLTRPLICNWNFSWRLQPRTQLVSQPQGAGLRPGCGMGRRGGWARRCFQPHRGNGCSVHSEAGHGSVLIRTYGNRANSGSQITRNHIRARLVCERLQVWTRVYHLLRSHIPEVLNLHFSLCTRYTKYDHLII